MRRVLARSCAAAHVIYVIAHVAVVFRLVAVSQLRRQQLLVGAVL
jgi:hypothetical protein